MLNTHVMVSIHHVANGHGNNQKRYIVETQDRALAVQLAFEHAETRLELRIVGQQLAWPVSTAYAQVAAAHGCIVLQVPVEEPAEEPEDDFEALIEAEEDEADELAVLPARRRDPLIDEWEEIMGRELRRHEVLALMAGRHMERRRLHP